MVLCLVRLRSLGVSTARHYVDLVFVFQYCLIGGGSAVPSGLFVTLCRAFSSYFLYTSESIHVINQLGNRHVNCRHSSQFLVKLERNCNVHIDVWGPVGTAQSHYDDDR